MLPDYAKIREPKLFYASSSDGYNIGNLYRKCGPIQNDYNFSLFLIQTTKNRVFGFFTDEVMGRAKDYIGSPETFIFTLRPELNTYYDTGANTRFLLCEEKYF